MKVFIESERPVNSHWGLCPDCHMPPVLVNYYKLNVATCSKCKVGWTVGYNLVGIPTHGDEAEAVGAKLRGYRKVEALEAYDPPVRHLTLI